MFSAGPGREVQSLTFTVQDDDLPEEDEEFQFNLIITNGHGMLGDPDRTKVTVVANDNAYGIFSLATVSLPCYQAPGALARS